MGVDRGANDAAERKTFCFLFCEKNKYCVFIRRKKVNYHVSRLSDFVIELIEEDSP